MAPRRASRPGELPRGRSYQQREKVSGVGRRAHADLHRVDSAIAGERNRVVALTLAVEPYARRSARAGALRDRHVERRLAVTIAELEALPRRGQARRDPQLVR